MKTLKLVGAKTYMGPRIREKDKVLNKGETYSFEDADAEALLQEFQTDLLNNPHPLFEEVDDTAPVKAAASPARVQRTRRAVPA